MSGGRQTRLGSVIEAWINILVGCGVAFVANMLVMPLVGIQINHQQNFYIVVFMTFISFVRSYLLRRLFNSIKLFHHEA